MIGEREVQAYKRDGVIVVPDVLDGQILGRIRQVVAELVAGAAAVAEHTDVYDLEPGHTPADPRVRRIKTPHKVHAVFDEAVRKHLTADADTSAIRRQAMQEGLRPLRLAGAMKVAEGLTTLDEVLRSTPEWVH